MHIYIILIIFITFIIIYNYNINLYYKKIEGFDNKIYFVNDLPDSLDAANFLAKIMTNIRNLIDKILKDFNENDKNDIKYYEYIKNIKNKLDNLYVCENPLDNNYTSYTVNKGEKIVLCIRDKKTKKLQDINDILYVAIHEISHIGCPEYGHTNIFNEINYYILKKAVDFNIYKYVDYFKVNKPYCGIELNSTIL